MDPAGCAHSQRHLLQQARGIRDGAQIGLLCPSCTMSWALGCWAHTLALCHGAGLPTCKEQQTGEAHDPSRPEAQARVGDTLSEGSPKSEPGFLSVPQHPGQGGAPGRRPGMVLTAVDSSGGAGCLQADHLLCLAGPP